MKVIQSKYFKYDTWPLLPMGVKVKLYDFISVVEAGNVDGLKGRNKSSNNVDPNNHLFVSQSAYAQKHKLWHYHLGVPKFDKSPEGDYTSDWMVHYKKFDAYIEIVDANTHPFKMPNEQMLEQK